MANFYLQVVDALKRVKYSEEYINALVNSGDFRSMGIVDSIMNHINEQHKQDEEEDIPAHVQQFLDFLKRRRAYLYVEKRQFEEAKKMLNAMLDDPGNRDFAINELAFIQKLEKGE